MTNERFLPLGSSSFRTLRKAGEIYVDKTEMIHALARGRGKMFLTRPRRFGKSLLISTFASLFRYGLRDFKGLAIESLWKDSTYDVLQLDFSSAKEFRTKADFLRRFDRMLTLAAEEAGLDIPPSDEGPVVRLQRFLGRCPSNSLVLLVDEYDAPLTAHLDDPELFESVREELSTLYANVKQFEGCLRFCFITGITRVSGTSIISAFNNLQDITLLPRYGTLLGYTEEEIERSFGDHLSEAERAFGLPREELMRELRENYDGYSFDQAAKTHVYCPWSVLSFLANPDPDVGFANYWYQTGGRPTVLMKFGSSCILVGNAAVRERDLHA